MTTEILNNKKIKIIKFKPSWDNTKDGECYLIKFKGITEEEFFNKIKLLLGDLKQ